MTNITLPTDWYVLLERVSKIENEIVSAHARIRNLIDRTMNLEHYIGLRSHSFNGDYTRQYDFQQISKDFKKGERPQTLYKRKKDKGV